MRKDIGKLNFLFLAMIVALAVASSQQVYAAPVIGNLTGTISNGASLTINGSGFGTKSTAAPISWDTFETGTDGNNLSTPDVGPTWTFLSVAPYPQYSNANSYAGSMSAKIQWQNYSISSFGWTNRGPFDEMYISFWRYMDPQDPGEVPSNHKILYLYGNNNAYAPELPQFMVGAVMVGWNKWRYAVQNFPTANWTFPVSTPDNWAETINKWQRWEMYVKLDSPYTSSNGEIKGWVDAEITVNKTGLNLTDIDGKYKDFRLGHMFQGYHAGGTDKSFFDNVYVDSTQSRVEIGNASTWDACTNRIIQIPTAWSNTSTVVTLNYGSLGNVNNMYLYVVDSAGAVNATGYPLCSTCPAAPVNPAAN